VRRLAFYIALRMLPWAAAALLCAALLFLATQLLRIAPALALADASFGEIARDLGLLLVPVCGFALPPAFAVAVFAVGGRMAEDGELVALDAAGIPRTATALGPLALASILATASGSIWLAGAPAACRALRADALRLGSRAVAARIEPGRFEEPFPGVTVFADAAEGGRLRGVFLADGRDASRELQVTAARAELTGSPDGAASMTLEDGEAFASLGGEGHPAAIRFESLSLRAPSSGWRGATDGFLPDELAESTLSLLGPPPEGSDAGAWGFALWRRVAGPIGFLALALASTALAFALPWRRRGLAVACAAALFLAFHAAGRLGELLLARGSLGPAAAALAPGAIVLAATALLLIFRRRSGVVQKA
jgi:lipopolysaccharide export system permease protein